MIPSDASYILPRGAKSLGPHDELPNDAIAVFTDGDMVQAVYKDFKNIMESPVGFGKTAEEAVLALRACVSV